MAFRCRFAIALLITIACSRDSGPTTPGPPSDNALAEDHPPPVSPANQWIRAAWAGNGAELAFVLADSTTAVALNPSTGATRVVYAAAPDHIYQVGLSADGKEAFTVSGPASAETNPGQVAVSIRRHSAGGTEVITERLTLAGSPLNLRAVEVAANGDFAYIVGYDSLFVRARDGGAPKFIGTTCFSIVAIAPAGDGVICYGTSLFRHALTGSTTRLAASDASAAIREVVWNPEGIFLVSDPVPPVCLFVICTRGSERYAFEKHSDPATKFLTPTYPLPETTWLISLSRDGRSFAYANHYCANSSDNVICGKNQYIFYVADGVSRTTRRIAVHGSSVVSLAISPDGTRVAYLAGGQLYILSAK